MHILVLGATGRVGKSVIEYALAAGHEVKALARNRAKIVLTDPRLSVLEGDLYKPQEIVEALQQPLDAVINVIGSDVFKPSTVVTDSVKSAFTIMEKHAVTRYLGITGIAEMQPAGAFATITTALLRRSPIRHAVSDHDRAFALVKASPFTWTLAGCPYIRDGKHTGAYKVVPDIFPGGFRTISPQDVADFLVKELDEQRFPRHIVGIWN